MMRHPDSVMTDDDTPAIKAPPLEYAPMRHAEAFAAKKKAPDLRSEQERINERNRIRRRLRAESDVKYQDRTRRLGAVRIAEHEHDTSKRIAIVLAHYGRTRTRHLEIMAGVTIEQIKAACASGYCTETTMKSLNNGAGCSPTMVQAWDQRQQNH